MASNLKKIVSLYNSTSLIARIVVGLIIGLVLGLVCPGAQWVALLGDLFVGALKAIAPVLVFALVSSALVQGQEKLDNRCHRQFHVPSDTGAECRRRGPGGSLRDR